MNIKFNVKDLPEYGLRLISLGDPGFDQKASAFLSRRPRGIAEVIMPISVILENRGHHALVSTRLNWEITETSGKVVTMPVGGLDPWAIINGGNLARTADYSGAVIPPGSTRFISLIGMAAEGRQVEQHSWQPGFLGSSQTEMEEFNKAFMAGEEEEVFRRSSLFKHLSEAASITVSIGGVFFDNGAFAGENRTGFFELGKAATNAQYDLATEISVALKHGRSAAEVVEQIRERLKASLSANSGLGPQSARGSEGNNDQPSVTEFSMLFSKPVGSYEFFKDMYTQRFLRLNDAVGATEAISRTLQLVDKPRKELRKL
jgi:hypothetical protein